MLDVPLTGTEGLKAQPRHGLAGMKAGSCSRGCMQLDNICCAHLKMCLEGLAVAGLCTGLGLLRGAEGASSR